jgi:hypothetical protein
VVAEVVVTAALVAAAVVAGAVVAVLSPQAANSVAAINPKSKRLKLRLEDIISPLDIISLKNKVHQINLRKFQKFQAYFCYTFITALLIAPAWFTVI